MFSGLLMIFSEPRLRFYRCFMQGSVITMSERFSRATHNGKRPKRTDLDAARKPEVLTDPRIEALREFADDTPKMRGYWKDSKVFGLSIFLSTHRLALPPSEARQRQGDLQFQDARQMASHDRG
jgi:hypothetical protein